MMAEEETIEVEERERIRRAYFIANRQPPAGRHAADATTG